MKVIVVKLPKDVPDVHQFGLLSDIGDEIYNKFTTDGVAIWREGPPANELRIEVSATRHLGVVTTFLKKALKRAGLSESAVITRGDSAN